MFNNRKSNFFIFLGIKPEFFPIHNWQSWLGGIFVCFPCSNSWKLVPTSNQLQIIPICRYINQALQPLHSSASKQKDHSTNADGQLYGHTTNYNSNTQDLAHCSPKNMLSLATGPSGQSEVAYPCPRKTVAVPIPMSGITFDNLSTPYSSEVSPLFFSQSGLAKVENPCLAHHQELTFQANSFHPYDLETRNSQQFHNLVDQNGNYSTNETEHEKRQKLESLEDQGNLSSASGQSGSSSFCTGNGNVDQVAVVRNGTESGNESSHRSVLREVALSKFRLKRKDRCFEKKVYIYLSIIGSRHSFSMSFMTWT